jgi:YHS domain-containing protein
MEPADRSNETEDLLKEYTLQRIRNDKAKASLPYSGACYYCSSDVPQPKVFCSTDCRDDFEREQRLLKIAGRGS